MMEDKELRHAPLEGLLTLARVLEELGAWKMLMENIPAKLNASPEEDFVPKYNSEHVKIIEMEAAKQRRNCAEILFEEWGTSGRRRPTLEDLLKILVKAELYRAADIVAVDILKGRPVSRPNTGPAAAVDTSLTRLLAERDKVEVENALKGIGYPKSFPEIQTFNRNLDNKPPKHIKEKNMPDMEPLSSEEQGIDSALTESSEIVDNESYLPAISLLLDKDHKDTSKFDYNSVIEDNYNIPNFDMLQSSTDLNIPNLSLLQNTSFNSDDDNNPSVNQHQLSTKLPHFDFEEIKKATNHFDQVPSEDGKVCKIGTGGWGEVYLAKGLFGYPVAVKKLKLLNVPEDSSFSFELKQFKTEVEVISKYKHENLMLLLGYSCNTSNYCLIYEYIDGGTLKDNIKNNESGPETRMKIALGIAKGIEHLHCGHNPCYIIHRDITSANILLTKDLVPKLGDFGLIRTHSDHKVTSFIIGTSIYMSPEAYRGEISPGMDVYSFGVVLLELLTGLPPSDKNTNIVTRVEEDCRNGKIDTLLDTRNGEWKQANEIYNLTKQCIRSSKIDRPNITVIVNTLTEIVNN